MRLKFTFIYFLFVLLTSTFFSSCYKDRKGIWEVIDASRDTVFFDNDSSSYSPNAIILNITGQTDDSIMIQGVVIPGGEINEKIRLDWYNKNVSVDYKSYKATTGNLKISYLIP